VTRKTRETLSHSGGLGMGLSQAYRNRGYGRRLLQATLDAARKAGFERVELDVYTTNTNAIRLYESMGFVREGLKRRYVKIDGTWLDAIDMAWLP
jgi:RimJ/RimL family protein N-acetyltransferase